MKRLWIAAALLAAVFTATLINSHYLGSLSSELSDLLTLAEQRAEDGDWEQADRLTKEALEIWNGHDLYLYTTLRHSDTDLVFTGFREVQEFINCQEGGEYSAANAKLIAQIELLWEMEQFSLKNLL